MIFLFPLNMTLMFGQKIKDHLPKKLLKDGIIGQVLSAKLIFLENILLWVGK